MIKHFLALVKKLNGLTNEISFQVELEIIPSNAPALEIDFALELELSEEWWFSEVWQQWFHIDQLEFSHYAEGVDGWKVKERGLMVWSDELVPAWKVLKAVA